MPHEGLALQIEVEVISLMLVALGVYIVSRRIRIPYTIALVLTGIAISLLGPASLGELFPVQLDSDLILLVFLPGLIFEAAYSLSLEELRENLGVIMWLAVPGLLVSTGIVGAVLHFVLGIDFEVALLFGALISATDPVSVLALFRELRVPKRLSILMEGESLFNDGTAVVIFFILLETVQGGDVSATQGVQQFVIVVAGGALTGYMVGLAANALLGWRYVADEHAIQIAFTIILAYGTYLLAEELLHVSPVIAVVIAG
ncbi:MAG: cation:proton antiporter, partial [Anaerolineae bacterium]|nr:cation:proton antiporter [Anaerolineae bacterium]